MTTNDALPFSQACENNKLPILSVLRNRFDQPACILEIGTGTAQHAIYFAEQLPHLIWQPADQADWLARSALRLRDYAPANVLAVRELDVRVSSHWDGLEADHVFSANTIHYMSWQAARCLFEGVGQLLKSGTRFMAYGPFNEHGHFTSESNRRFDSSLKSRDPALGIRDKGALDALAKEHGMCLTTSYVMPANNQLLEFTKN